MARAHTHETDCNSRARRYSGALMLLAIASLLVACGGGAAPAANGGGGGVVISCATGGATNAAELTWDAVSDLGLAGYKIYYGTATGTYSQVVDVNNVTTHTVMGLSSGTTYYFAATAYDSSSPPNESGFSNIVCKTFS